MGRPKKNTESTELSVPSEVKISPLAMPDAIAMMREMVLQDNPEFTGDLEQILGARTIGYLYARMNGMNHLDAVQIANIAPIEVEMWSKKPEFQTIMGVIKQAEATMVEAVTWQMAMNPTASIERMFALKARKAEYKENGQPVSQTVTNVRISIEGQEFDVSANFKDKEVE